MIDSGWRYVIVSRRSIVDELRSTPEWQRYVDLRFDGLEGEAILDVRDRWYEAVNKSAGSIEPTLFTHIFKERFFDFPDSRA